jgi:hypothetical protein
MANLSITEAQVVASTEVGVGFSTAIAGEAIAVGEPCYRKASDSKFYRAKSSGTSEEAEVIGVAVSKATAAGQKCTVQRNKTVTVGAAASVVAGTVFVLAATAGKIAPAADLAATNKVTVIGVGATGNGITLVNWASGNAVPA